jgi:hypothetical protein
MGEEKSSMNDNPIPINKEVPEKTVTESSKSALIFTYVLVSVVVLSVLIPLSAWLTRLALGG